MPAPATISEFLHVVRKSKQVDTKRLDAYVQRQGNTLPPEPKKLAAMLVRDGMLTAFQAEQFLQGKYKGFALAGYRIIERVGSGGTGTVYLGEHEVMKRRVAIKVLPPAVANDPSILERFRREAQAVATLDHPNIVRAYDFRQEASLYLLVMEFVDGPSLQQVLDTKGALTVGVACEYIRQAALGLQHAHEADLVHRDIKPANLLIDNSGTVKLLDLGLARFAPQGQESVTKKFDENMVMGTADFLAPEQAINLHNVDSRADIYSLGATLYTLLAGEPPFGDGTVTQKLLWHQMRDPVRLEERNRNVPVEVADIVHTMMEKDPNARYQHAIEVAEALEPFCAGSSVPQSAVRLGAATGGKTSSKLRGGRSVQEKEKERDTGRLPQAHVETVTEKPDHLDGDDSRERKRRRRSDPDIDISKRRRHSGMGGILLLIGAMFGILALVGGVIAFLVFGPSPNATSVKSAVPDEVEVKPSVIPGPQWQPPQPAPKPPLGELHRFAGHGGGAERVAFSKDGKLLLSCGRDKVARIWSVDQKRQLAQLTGHADHVLSVAFNKAANQVLTSSGDGTARLWAAPQWKEAKKFPLPKTRIWAAIFGHDDNEVLTGGEDKEVKLWNARDGKMIRAMKGHNAAINALAYRSGSPQQHQAISASLDKTLRLWDLDTGKTLHTLSGHGDAVTCVAVSENGATAVSGSRDGTVRLWDLNSGKPIHTFPPPSKMQVFAVAISSDGHLVLSGGNDRMIRLWNIPGKKPERAFAGHTGEVTGLAFAPNGQQFVSASLDQTVRLWKVNP